MSEAERAFTIAVEGLRGDFRVFGEALSSLGERVTTLGERMTTLDERLTTLDGNFTAFRVDVGERFDRVEGRLDRVEGRLGRVEGDIGLLKEAVVENTREIRKLQGAVEKKVDRDEVVAIVERVVVARDR